MNHTPTSKNHKKPTGKIVVIVLAIAVVLAAGAVIFLQARKINQLDSSSTDAAAVQKVTDKVSKLIILPDETPALATVSNADELKKQAFFADVKDGDKVLIFAKAAKVIVFRPDDNKIVNVGPISVADGATDKTTDK